jgi:aldehyde:ferredoxin oxidoreductase
MYDDMPDEYYAARGWDENGTPKHEAIRDLYLK